MRLFDPCGAVERRLASAAKFFVDRPGANGLVIKLSPDGSHSSAENASIRGRGV
jgi:hypothetical protein